MNKPRVVRRGSGDQVQQYRCDWACSRMAKRAASHLVTGNAERAEVLQLAEAAAPVDGADVVGVPGVPFQALTHQPIGSRLEAVRAEAGRQLCQLPVAPPLPAARSLLNQPAHAHHITAPHLLKHSVDANSVQPPKNELPIDIKSIIGGRMRTGSIAGPPICCRSLRVLTPVGWSDRRVECAPEAEHEAVAVQLALLAAAAFQLE